MAASLRDVTFLALTLVLLPAAAQAAAGKAASGPQPASPGAPGQQAPASGVPAEQGPLNLPPEALRDPVTGAAAVVGIASSLYRVADFCAAKIPSSAERVHAARKQWEAANGKLVDKSWTILRAKLPPADLTRLNASMDKTLQDAIANLDRAAPEQKNMLCATLPGRFSAPQANLMANRQLVDTIMNAH